MNKTKLSFFCALALLLSSTTQIKSEIISGIIVGAISYVGMYKTLELVEKTMEQEPKTVSEALDIARNILKEKAEKAADKIRNVVKVTPQE